MRAVLAVVVGYVAMFVAVFVSFTVAYLILGTERSFQPASYEASMLWIVVATILGFIAAMIGGCVCATIAKGARIAPYVLAGLVLVLGLLFAVPLLLASDEPPMERTGDVSNWEAMANAKQPAWVALLNPVVGAVGVIIGAGLGCRRKAAQAS